MMMMTHLCKHLDVLSLQFTLALPLSLFLSQTVSAVLLHLNHSKQMAALRGQGLLEVSSH